MPDNNIIRYLEPLDKAEQFYKKYFEYKNDRNKLKELLYTENNYIKYGVPDVYPNVSFFETTTLKDNEYTDNITIRKHRRYGPMFLHNHTFFEINYILKGSADNTINGKHIKMSEGDMCFIKPGIYHTLGVFDESIVINILVSDKILDDSFKRNLPDDNITNFMYKICNDNFLLFHTLHDTNISSLLDMLIKEGITDNICYIKKSILLTILNYLISKGNYEKNNTSQEESRINSIIEYIQENYANTSLKSISDHFNLSIPYLSRYIKNNMGTSFVNILQRIKIREACYLLSATDTNISDIPGLVGYESIDYFNRVFSRKMAITPYKYRQMHKTYE